MHYYIRCPLRQGQYPWVEAIKVVLGNCELDIAYTLPKWFLHDRLKASVKENLKRLTHRQWQEAMEINELCQTYKQHKTELEQEKYLSMLSIENYKTLARFRCASAKLPTVKAFYRGEELTFCNLCEEPELPNEMHLLLKCERFAYARAEFLPSFRNITEPIQQVYQELINTQDPVTLKQLATLIGFIFSFL